MATLNDTESNKRVGFGILSLLPSEVGGSGTGPEKDQISISSVRFRFQIPEDFPKKANLNANLFN